MNLKERLEEKKKYLEQVRTEQIAVSAQILLLEEMIKEQEKAETK